MRRKELNNHIVHDSYVYHRYAEDIRRRYPKATEAFRWTLATAIMFLAIIGIYHLIGMAVGVW